MTVSRRLCVAAELASSRCPRRRTRVFTTTATLIAAVVVGLVAGCGGGGRLEPRENIGGAEQLLTRADVGQHEDGTPQRALFACWRAIQHANLDAFLESFEPQTRKRLADDPETGQALSWYAGWTRTAQPRVESVEIGGGGATVYARIEHRTPLGSTRFTTWSIPQAFAFVRHRGDWKFADDYFVQRFLPAGLRRPDAG